MSGKLFVMTETGPGQIMVREYAVSQGILASTGTHIKVRVRYVDTVADPEALRISAINTAREEIASWVKLSTSKTARLVDHHPESELNFIESWVVDPIPGVPPLEKEQTA